ncbi:thioredoxin family protein [Sphingobacterium sp. JB170]|uniref:thioredoxin family protein n=1 Tax=Sphingobacterium sp. JB170 TaxID=1434842 RepID=UPI00097F2B99|nr:thioredoxin family protein [Sphingobacterium sp. JB170]SJN34067.1 hypothetical protein FM107_08100 [Sphingobacterium sp. JB170]
MKVLTLTILSLLLCSRISAQQKKSVNWITFEQLSDSLQIKPKKVLLFFHTEWCAYCRKMQNEVFTNPQVINDINERYYAVSFDAESTDSIYFEGHLLKNASNKKRVGHNHDIATLLARKDAKFIFPTTIILHADFSVQKRYFTYLGPKAISQILTR